MPLFDEEFLPKLEYLSIVSRKVFQGQMMAQRRSRQLGGGIEFADHRQYAAGDDFRYLDWNLYARHDELLLKRFQEEQDLHVYLLLDCSASMSVGDGAKFRLARQVAAAIAYIALADLDRIAVFAFADSVLHEFPLTRGKSGIHRLFEFLENLPSVGEGTDLTSLATDFCQRSLRHGLAILMSDFLAPGGYQKSLDILKYNRFDPQVIQIHTPSEASPGLLGDVELVDSETSEVRKITVSEKQVSRYQRVFQEFLSGLKSYCAKAGVGCLVTDTSQPFDQVVMRLLRQSGEA